VYNHEIADALRIRPFCGFVDASTLPSSDTLTRVHLELDELIEAYRPVRLVVGSAALRAMADEALEDEMRRSLKP
jgi:hypothetical protein